MKAFADDIMNLNEILKLVLGRLENIVGKGENSAFPLCFQKASF